MSRSLVLASASPQRRAILERIGASFTVCPAHVEELSSGDPEHVVRENALRKARAVWERQTQKTGAGREGRAPSASVLGVDTIVALGRRVYGKPTHEREARETLTALGGVTHTVFSGVALLHDGGREQVAVARTRVSFRELDERLIDWYLASGEWRERAGGYAIQGAGAALVRGVDGDYENVVGLPVGTLLDMCPDIL
jgi:septum formation protein